MSADIIDRWASLARGEPLTADPAEPPTPKTKYYVPLVDAADDFTRWAQSSHERIYTGFPALDAEMRGIAPGEMCNLIGFSHGGKTLVLLKMLEANRDKRIAFFTPDEPRTLVLMKLACVAHGVGAIDLERAIARDDTKAIDMLRATALDLFPNLAVFDAPLTISDMEKATAEVSDHWGQDPDWVILDYLQLLQGAGEDVASQANAVKAWGRRHEVPLLVLHQTSRTSGADGKKLTISSGAFGGEQQATHIIGVRRKVFDIQAQINELESKLDRSAANEKAMERLGDLRYEMQIHKHTLTINLTKNKRPGGSLLDDMDYEIEYGTGRITALNGDLPKAYLSETRAA